MPLEGRKLHVAISEKETCPIHRDWHDEETDFKEKSVRYTEIRHTISHMKSRMRESRTSGSVRGVPCERYVYSTLVLTEEIKIKYDCIKYGLDVSYLIIFSLIIKLGVKGFYRDKIATSIREKVEDEYK